MDNLVKELQDKMDHLLKFTKGIINEIPDDEKSKISFMTKDIAHIQKCVKNGDLSGLEELTKRYASTDSKH